MSDVLCGKPNTKKRPCRLKRMRGFDGCERHGSPPMFVYDRYRARPPAESCGSARSM